MWIFAASYGKLWLFVSDRLATPVLGVLNALIQLSILVATPLEIYFYSTKKPISGCLKIHTGAFDVLVYTDKDEEIPIDWEESDPHFIALSQEVRLKSFSTSVHKVDTMVAYKTDL